MVDQRLKQVPLFAGLDDEDLDRICRGVEDLHLDAGDILFHEGDTGDRAYIIVDGRIEILKETGKRQVLLAMRGENEVIGEMALLQEEPRNATARAFKDADLLTIPKSALDDLLATSPRASRAIFETLLARERENTDRMRHIQRMAQLGTLTAGVAHELNNPAAAAQRAAAGLLDAIDELLDAGTQDIDPGIRARVRDLVRTLRDADTGPRSVLAQANAEEELEDWLDEHTDVSSGRLAGTLADAGVTPAHLDRLQADGAWGPALHLLSAGLKLTSLGAGLVDAGQRISDLVAAFRSHNHHDQAPVQNVDVTTGIEDTLKILNHKTKHVRIVREYAEDLPRITAFGSELNQVWTNLIDNACDALEGVEDPTITIRTYKDVDDDVVIEIEDNGPGIPEDLHDQIFDAFFTTKGVGAGTGLGLQITQRIVVLDHRGELDLGSVPGRTVFRVTLPIHRPDLVDQGGTP